MRVEDLDDLKWSTKYEIGDTTISIIQGKGCFGKRHSNTFEVLVWDSDGNIPLGFNEIGEYMSEDEVVELINSIKKFKHGDKTWAEYQRHIWEN